MESVEQQWQQLKERYSQMTEDELVVLAQEASDLTEVAQEALQAVIAERGLDIHLKMEPPAQLPGHPPEDEALVILGLGRECRASRAHNEDSGRSRDSVFPQCGSPGGRFEARSCSVGGRI